MIDRAMRWNAPLCQYISEYSDRNATNEYRPVAVGRYGIRTRESIYSKELAADYSKNKLIYKDTLTVGMGSVQIDIGVLTDNVTYSVSPAYHTYKISDINSNYLDYCLQQRNQDMFIRYVKRGSRQGKSIDLKRWITYEIPVYPMEVQHEIVDNLNRVKNIITFRQHQLTELDNLVKSRFIEMFGDPVLNPRRWRKVPLEENATLLNGRAYKQEELLDTGKYPVLRVGNFFSNRGWYYSDLELEDDKYCDNGDLLYAWSASFGPQIWNGGKVIYHYHIWKVLVGEAYNKMFLCKLLEYVTSSLMSDTHGIAMMHLTKSGMEKTEFIVPPLAKQEEFSEFVSQTDKSKLAVRQSLEKLETLKKSLMQEYFG